MIQDHSLVQSLCFYIVLVLCFYVVLGEFTVSTGLRRVLCFYIVLDMSPYYCMALEQSHCQ
jgi:hypothetical protein